jgi:hypothetical protein
MDSLPESSLQPGPVHSNQADLSLSLEYELLAAQLLFHPLKQAAHSSASIVALGSARPAIRPPAVYFDLA